MTTGVKVEYPDSILDPDFHGRLIADIDRYAAIAGVPKHMIHEPMAKYCDMKEIGWIRNIMFHRDKGIAGLCLTGINKTQPVETRMQAMVAALLRNYVDARVRTMVNVLKQHQDGEVETPSVLAIPNFYVEYAGGKSNPSWQLQVLQDLLMQRIVGRQMTLIYVQSLDSLKQAFGEAIGVFIEAHWTILTANK